MQTVLDVLSKTPKLIIGYSIVDGLARCGYIGQGVCAASIEECGILNLLHSGLSSKKTTSQEICRHDPSASWIFNDLWCVYLFSKKV